MNAIDLNNLSSTYNLSPIEINCIILSLAIDNKLLAFNYTIAYQNKAKNKDVLCNRFFHREETQRFISEQRNNFIDNRVKVNMNVENTFVADLDRENSNTKQKESDTIGISGISGENIKELLEREYNKTTDPEKRTVLLIKIADFIGLKNNDQDDPLTPTIYLPSRCQSCLKH